MGLWPISTTILKKKNMGQPNKGERERTKRKEMKRTKRKKRENVFIDDLKKNFT